MKIELLYFDDCPGHAELRERLPGLLEQAGVETTIQERRIDSEDAAIAERFPGSPTLRIDGRDVDPSAEQREDYGLRCRLYPSAEGLQRRPPDALITQALAATRAPAGRSRVKSPARNRVTPMGDIEAIPLRGAWTGNRGILHSGPEIVRFHASDLWITCALQFRGRWHEQWQPRHYTFLYFHDEAVSFAAGHRPCAECRREAYNAYRAAWAQALGVAPPSAKLINQQLHGERIVRGTHRRRLHAMFWADLPDGAFVRIGQSPAVVVGQQLTEWTPAGYATGRARPRRGVAEVITPPSTIAALRAGYPVQIDDTARH